MASSSSPLLKGIGALVLLLVAVSLVFTIVSMVVSFVSWFLSLLFSLAVLGLIGYGIYWMAGKLLGGDDGRATLDDTSFDVGSTGRQTGTSRREPESQGISDPVDNLREQYANGQISESEFERELERELGTRSLEREVGMRDDEEYERN